jgi:hypothetical protein
MAPENNQQNRLFIIIAVGLVGTLVLGLLGIGGLTILSRLNKEQQLAKATATPVIKVLAPTPKASATAIAAVPAIPTPTATPVVVPTKAVSPTAGAVIPASPTTPTATAQPNKAVIPVNNKAGEVPKTGVGVAEGLFAGFAFFFVASLSHAWRKRR